MTTRLPYTYLIWIGLNLLFSMGVLIYNNFIFTLILETVFGTFTYLTICRYACRIVLSDNKLEVKYYFPYMGKEKVEFSGSDFIRYELGYYYYLNSEHSLSTIQFLHPHDTISFYTVKDKKSHYHTINININYFDFKKIRQELEKKVQVIKSYE